MKSTLMENVKNKMKRTWRSSAARGLLHAGIELTRVDSLVALELHAASTVVGWWHAWIVVDNFTFVKRLLLKFGYEIVKVQSQFMFKSYYVIT